MHIIGRNNEIEQLKRLESSSKSEFVAVYGRRRIGKTFLIRNYFKDRFSLYVSGLKNGDREQQLKNFYTELLKKHTLKKTEKPGKNWMEAFQHLIQYLEKSKAKKKIVFIDELPWMSTAKSDFLIALEHFWNHWASARKDILLIVCGSAASWMIDNLLRNKGGLHNRVTDRIKLEPFTLSETEEYLKSQKFTLSKFEITKLYMIMGGIPFYLSLLNNKKTIPRNIDDLCFSSSGALKGEYHELYSSLFSNPQKHLKIIETLAQKGKGMKRDELIKASKLSNGGTVTKVLEELEESGFIHKYIPADRQTRDAIYKLGDYFSLFHLKFIKNKRSFDKNFWSLQLNTPVQNTWAGFTFELVCFDHTEQIKKALGITGMQTQTSVWSNQSAQIDLIIERADNNINLFEIKFNTGMFSINQTYYKKLLQKISEFQQHISRRQAIHLVMITTFGLTPGKYNDSIIQNQLILDDLFSK